MTINNGKALTLYLLEFLHKSFSLVSLKKTLSSSNKLKRSYPILNLKALKTFSLMRTKVISCYKEVRTGLTWLR